jgi:hypothetical protein
MASASSWYARRAPHRDALREAAVPAAAGIAALSLPFLFTALFAAITASVSGDAAGLGAAVTPPSASQPELALRYPPIPTWLAWLAPWSTVIAPIAGGVLLWLAGGRAAEHGAPSGARVVAFAAAIAHPAVLGTLSRDLAGATSLLLLTLAWMHVHDFIEAGRTRAAFLAGLTMAGGVFAGPHALVMALAIAALTAVSLNDPDVRARAAAGFVMAFPAVGCVLAFAYVQWSAGLPITWLPLAAPDAALPGVWLTRAASALAGSLAGAPLWAYAAIAAARRGIPRAAVFAAPVVALAASGAAGFTGAAGYGAALLVTVALTGIPGNAGPRVWKTWAAIALMQTLLAYAVPGVGAEPARRVGDLIRSVSAPEISAGPSPAPIGSGTSGRAP